MTSTKTKIQCKPCKTFITEKNYPNHLKSFTHIQKILPNIIITTPEGKSTIFNFRTNTIYECNKTCIKCLITFYSPCNGVNLWQRNTCSNSCSKNAHNTHNTFEQLQLNYIYYLITNALYTHYEELDNLFNRICSEKR